jgi:hypothetical protein
MSPLRARITEDMTRIVIQAAVFGIGAINFEVRHERARCGIPFSSDIVTSKVMDGAGGGCHHFADAEFASL